MTTPTLLAIALETAHRAPMSLVDTAEITIAEGLVGNVPQSSYRRVTLLSREQWEDVQTVAALPWHTRRANLLVEGLTLASLKGKTLRINDVELNVNGETEPCRLMDEAHHGLKTILKPDWRGGVYAAIQKGGTIKTGDPIEIVE